MWQKQKQHVLPLVAPRPTIEPLDPKRPYLAAVNRLSKRVPDLRAVFYHDGHVRTLTTESESVLFSEPMLGTPEQQARKFLDVSEIHSALDLRHVDLRKGNVEETPLGYRVTYVQEVITPEGVRFPVRGGAVDVHMNEDGQVFNVNSTLRHGRRNVSLAGIHSAEQAIAKAKDYLKFATYASERVELVFSAHKGSIDPVYEVVLSSDEPRAGEPGREVFRVLVKAQTLEVVDVYDMVWHHRKRGVATSSAIFIDQAKGRSKKKQPTASATTGSPVMGKVFLRIPDPNKPIPGQIHDALIESLPDPKVLRNDKLIMFAGTSKTPVQAKADGTYNYDPKDKEFSAVVVYFALNAQLDLYNSWGLKRQKGPITVRVEDRSTTDNAYFDGEGYLISIGVGSGLNSGGLNRYIAFDLGVSWHENGHHVVFLQTPGQDLPGDEGGGMHESIGDVLGDLLMDWWFRSKYGTLLGGAITVADIVADPRIIGVYAAPPRGIRIQKNTKKTPKDKTGEPHDDGLISGGAKADLLVAMVQQYGVEPGLESFGRLTLAALAIVPSHRVTFRDLLNAYLTADQSLNSGANKQTITASFAAHGITLNSSRGRGKNVPVIIVVG
jgi:Zn-dependent metalloprotease